MDNAGREGAAESRTLLGEDSGLPCKMLKRSYEIVAASHDIPEQGNQ